MKGKLLAGIAVLGLLFMPVQAESNEWQSGNGVEQTDKVQNESQPVLKKINDKVSEYVKINGLIIARGLYTDQPGKYDNFDVRFMRLSATGKLGGDFSYRFQLELASDPRILDAWVDWKRYDFFNVRVGQFKRFFGYENMISPYNLGVSDFSQMTTKLCALTDRNGEHASGGRDAGVGVMGEFLKVREHNLFRYEIGVYNGNGINKSDNNKYKDVIGSVHFRPIKNLSIGAGLWEGKYGPEQCVVDRKRWTAGLKYDDSNFYFLGEYVASKGQKLTSKTVSMVNPDTNIVTSETLYSATGAEKSDGWSVTAGVPLIKNKLKLFGKWDVYRDDKTDATNITKYHASLDWYINKYVLVQATYVYTDDVRTSPDYNVASMQMCVKF